MPKLRRVLVLLGAVASMQAPFVSGEEVLLDGEVAYVNEHVITVSDILAAAQPMFAQLQREYRGNALKEKLHETFADVRDRLIDRFLILDSFSEERAKIPDWVVEQRIEEIVRDQFGGDRMKLMETLSKDGISYDRWRTEALNHMIVSSVRHGHVTERVHISPANVRREYNENIDRYMKPAEVKLRMIVLREGVSKETPGGIRKRLSEGEDFAEIAKKVSVDPKAEEGGDWGWMSLNDLRFELVEAVTAAKDSKEPCHVLSIPGEKDTYVFKVEGWRPASKVSFEEVQPEEEKALRKKEEQRLYDEWIARLKEQAYVKVLDVNVF